MVADSVFELTQVFKKIPNKSEIVVFDPQNTEYNKKTQLGKALKKRHSLLQLARTLCEEMDLIVEFLGTLTDESLTPRTPSRVPSGLPVIDEKFQQSKARISKNKTITNTIITNKNMTQSGE